MSSQKSSRKKIALITGGTGYLGYAIAKKIAQDGMTVIILYNKTPLEKVKELTSSLPGSGHMSYSCDLSSYAEVISLLDSVEKDCGPIFLCVHAAAQKPRRKKIYLTSEIEMRNQIEGTFIPAFNVLSLLGKKMKERKEGVLVGITTSGVVVEKDAHSLGGYIPAKFAMQGVLASLHQELRGSGVRVHSVAPGFMAGGMNADIPQAFTELLREKSTDKKLTTPEDVAGVIGILCDDIHPYMQTLTVPVVKEYE